MCPKEDAVLPHWSVGGKLQSCEGVLTALDLPSRRTATGAIGGFLTASLFRLACDAESLHY